MANYLLMIVLVGSGFGYWYYNDTQDRIAELNKEIAVLQGAHTIQQDTIDSLENNLEVATEQWAILNDQFQAAESELNRYSDIFRKHNLNRLAMAKPGLIQNRINKGTEDVFKSIEDLSRDIEQLNTK